MGERTPYLAVWTLSSEVTNSGVARVAETLAWALGNSGTPVSRAAMGLTADASSNDHPLPMHPLATRVLTGERDLRRVVRGWRKHGAGTAHCHDPLQAAAAWSTLGGSLHRRVYTVHSLVAEELAAREQTASSWLVRSVLLRAEARALAGADVVHCLSHHVANLLSQSYPEVRPEVVPYGLRSLPPRRNGPTRRGHAICVRRLEPRTGVDLALETWRSTKGLPPLIVVGTGSLAERLREMAAAGSSSPVEFRGRASESELSSLYEGALVNVMPTRAMEGFGLPILEAAAYGVPTAGFDVGAVREVMLAQGQSERFLAPPHDTTALGEAVLAAARARPNERAELRARIASDWTMNARVAEFQRILGL